MYNTNHSNNYYNAKVEHCKFSSIQVLNYKTLLSNIHLGVSITMKLYFKLMGIHIRCKKCNCHSLCNYKCMRGKLKMGKTHLDLQNSLLNNLEYIYLNLLIRKLLYFPSTRLSYVLTHYSQTVPFEQSKQYYNAVEHWSHVEFVAL